MNSEYLVAKALDYLRLEPAAYFHLVLPSLGSPPGVHEYFGTGHVEGVDARAGRCYEMAGMAFVTDPVLSARDARLVHGTIHGPNAGMVRMGHGWVVLDDELMWEPTRGLIHPRDEWYAWARAHDERTYTIPEARSHMLRTGHYGRWHESEYE